MNVSITVIGGCIANPCSNGGFCLSTGLCQCPLGYTGQFCQTCKWSNNEILLKIEEKKYNNLKHFF